MLSLKAKIILALALVALYGLAATALSLSLTTSNIKFFIQDQHLTALLPDGRTVKSEAFIAAGQRIEARSELALDEPDVLPSYALMNQLFDTHQKLYQALQANNIKLLDDTGQLHTLTPQPRSLASLPPLFWLQLLCGLAGMVICVMVWLPATRNTAIRAFALTGLSYVLFSSAAAVYSTRAFFISGELFAVLSALNHIGALLFSSSLASFLWNYPCRAPTPWLSKTLYGVFILAIILDQTQLLATPVAGFHLWVMGIFLFGLLAAFWQWWKTRGQQEQRHALYWILLSILAGTVFFAGGMILPAILHADALASQGLLFTTFLLMYAGMALVVVRYHLFGLQAWWFTLWSWLLGGLLLVLTDIMLVFLLHLSDTLSLVLAVLLTGWIYFPLRQYFWHKLFSSQRPELDEWLTDALPVMLNAQHKMQENTAIEEALQAVFRPLSLQQSTQKDQRIYVLDKGKSLLISEQTKQCSWILSHADQGSRLFTRRDEKTAALVLSLYQLLGRINQARDEGVKQERHRIQRDIHDDLGAKLLQLLHRSSDSSKPLVREAIRDLRDLLNDMERESLPLNVVLLQWHEEVAQRCQDSGIVLNWQAQTSDKVLNADLFGEITRILREAVSNALKHAQLSTLTVIFSSDEQQLTVVISNDGLQTKKTVGAIRGLTIMANRASRLGGHCYHRVIENQWQVELSMPL